jgi:hypothetical protein
MYMAILRPVADCLCLHGSSAASQARIREPFVAHPLRDLDPTMTEKSRYTFTPARARATDSIASTIA